MLSTKNGHLRVDHDVFDALGHGNTRGFQSNNLSAGADAGVLSVDDLVVRKSNQHFASKNVADLISAGIDDRLDSRRGSLDSGNVFLLREFLNQMY